MKCPYCSSNDTKVVDKRNSPEGHSIRRRRECLHNQCSKRFTTYEHLDMLDLFVMKKDGKRETFDPEKLKRGIKRACEKRPVSTQQINEIVEGVHSRLLKNKSTEVTSTYVGELVMKLLKKIDKVAYIRFASVYREFTDLSSFKQELESLLEQRGQAQQAKQAQKAQRGKK